MNERINEIEPWVTETWVSISRKVERTSKRIGSHFPHVSKEGKYDFAKPSWWTAGFWPGLLWTLYAESGAREFRELAEQCEVQLDEELRLQRNLHHDIGFMWCLTSVANWKLTGSKESRQRALRAANLLAGRYNPKGRFIRAWNEEPFVGYAIIDCMMNISLLFWASETTGDPRYRHIAMEHADMAEREMIRPDGSACHIVNFDPETGECKEVLGGQGFAADSAWSRGCSWAVYGFTLAYAYTKETRYLNTARRAAHFFLANLPEDQIPYWDFRLPDPEGMPRDTSAAACAACGLLELSKAVQGAESRLFWEAGSRMLRALGVQFGAWANTEEEGLLRGATGNYPAGRKINVPLIYGDYFYVEGLYRLMGGEVRFW